NRQAFEYPAHLRLHHAVCGGANYGWKGAEARCSACRIRVTCSSHRTRLNALLLRCVSNGSSCAADVLDSAHGHEPARAVPAIWVIPAGLADAGTDQGRDQDPGSRAVAPDPCYAAGAPR